MIKKVLILAGLVCLAGCTPPHFKEMDSYGAMFREGEAAPTGEGDPYTFGGMGEGSGGLLPKQTSADDSGAPDPRDDTKTGRLGQFDKDRTETPDVKAGGETYTTIIDAGQRVSAIIGFEDVPTDYPNLGIDSPVR
jgi:hypothetical protein